MISPVHIPSCYINRSTHISISRCVILQSNLLASPVCEEYYLPITMAYFAANLQRAVIVLKGRFIVAACIGDHTEIAEHIHFQTAIAEFLKDFQCILPISFGLLILTQGIEGRGH